MSLIVFTGGARSGKSAAAQELAAARSRDGARVVVAVFGQPIDQEMQDRIERHRTDRPDHFETIEATEASSWVAAVPDGALLVVDCLGTLLGLLMDEEQEPDRVRPRFDELVGWIIRRPGDTIVVTNEVGEGVVPAYESGRVFRDILGRANRILANEADCAYLVVCGRLVDLTSMPRHAAWPSD